MDYLAGNIWLAWLIAFIIFLVVEGLTAGLVSIWFAAGALVALLISLVAKNVLWLQIVAFFVVSIATLWYTKPLAKKFNSSNQATNADMVIGKECVVVETIDNINGTGAVSVGGKIWTARSNDEAVLFEVGTRAHVDRIEGVKLIVK